MPFKRTPEHLRDIQKSLARIDDFLGSMTSQEMHADIKTESAVERQLQIVTEAAFASAIRRNYFVPKLIGAAYAALATCCDMAMTALTATQSGRCSNRNYRN